MIRFRNVIYGLEELSVNHNLGFALKGFSRNLEQTYIRESLSYSAQLNSKKEKEQKAEEQGENALFLSILTVTGYLIDTQLLLHGDYSVCTSLGASLKMKAFP